MKRIDTSHINWMDVHKKVSDGMSLAAIAREYGLTYMTFINRYNKEGSIAIEKGLEKKKRAKERAKRKKKDAQRASAQAGAPAPTRHVPALIKPTCYRVRGYALYGGRPKPCPVCGSLALARRIYGWYMVKCTKCNNKSAVCGRTEEEAVKFWNTDVKN